MSDPETAHKVLTGELPERRKIARHRVLKGARITFGDHRVSIDCTVRNLSELGACLKVPSPVGIPDAFDLVLTPNPLSVAA